MRCVFAFINDATYPLATNQSELDAENNKSIPRAPDSRGHRGKYFEGRRMRGIIDPAFLGRINGTMICLMCAIICHALRAWQTGVDKDQGDFKPEAAGGEPEP